MSRRGKTYNRIARDLIRQGRDLAQNGRDLGELEERMGGRVDEEARIRELCGDLVASVGECMLMEAHHRKTMGRLRRVRPHGPRCHPAPTDGGPQ